MILNILFENDDLIVCKKPAGVLAQGNNSFATDMVSALMTREVKKGGKPYIAPINRLDCPVSGIMLFAKNKNAAAKLTNQLTTHNMNKSYYAVVVGELTEEIGTFEDYLVKDAKTNLSKVVDEATPGAKKAKLNYTLVAKKVINGVNTSLVKIQLITGRHHQIRVQFSSRGLPLYADAKYGKAIRGENIALCACELTFSDINTGEKMKFNIEPEGSAFEYYL